MIVKIFLIGNFKYTPFGGFVEGDLNYLKREGIQIVNSVYEADILVSQSFKKIKKYFWQGLLGKRFLIWTNEPRFDTFPSHKRHVFFGLLKCFVMNVYTKNVHVSCFSFRTAGLIDGEIGYISDSFELKSKKIIALMSYYNGEKTKPLLINNMNVDLIGLRSLIALSGSEINAIDIYGRGWPNGISKEDTRDGDWGKSKYNLLKKYNFNLCFENTIAHNYVTEKIWDSIKNYCLPIYYGDNTNIYEIFPKRSFIDYSEFQSPKELFDFIDKLTSYEFVERMNSCIKVYNHIQKKGYDFIKNERLKMLNQIVLKANEIILS